MVTWLCYKMPLYAWKTHITAPLKIFFPVTTHIWLFFIADWTAQFYDLQIYRLLPSAAATLLSQQKQSHSWPASYCNQALFLCPYFWRLRIFRKVTMGVWCLPSHHLVSFNLSAQRTGSAAFCLCPRPGRCLGELATRSGHLSFFKLIM